MGALQWVLSAQPVDLVSTTAGLVLEPLQRSGKAVIVVWYMARIQEVVTLSPPRMRSAFEVTCQHVTPVTVKFDTNYVIDQCLYKYRMASKQRKGNFHKLDSSLRGMEIQNLFFSVKLMLFGDF